MTFERPRRPGQQQPAEPRRVEGGAGGQGVNRDNRGGNQGGGGHGGHAGNTGGNDQPTPWLVHPAYSTGQPEISPNASFVEYLRWMRAADHPHKDATKVQIVHLAQQGANYHQRLELLNHRIRRMAGEGNTFEVTCPWRIRVGGTKGPESMLLPAFDHTGIPYIPSSTLRGVARVQAIKEKIQRDHLSWKDADKAIAPWFGHLDAVEEERSGKVVFLDAYPLPAKPPNQIGSDNTKSGGLAIDIANSIWSWDGNKLKYSPNPNVFFSLKEATFLIGLCKGSGCTDEILTQVRKWLIDGLEQGAGSQINSGYGRLVRKKAHQGRGTFLKLPFTLQGQLIHGRQKFTQWNWNQNRKEWQHRGAPDAEVRPIAFKNMLRYWFRAFCLGVLPANQVQEWEAKVFGAITPSPKQGWLRVEILDGKILQREPRSNRDGQRDPVGEQAGTLLLSFSGECPKDKQEMVEKLFLNLTWMMFHLGGVGQGARRPCYSRRSRQYAPWWRGSTLIPQTDDEFWNLPESPREFQKLFQRRLSDFFEALKIISGLTMQPRNAGSVSQRDWTEAIDASCRIIVCSGDEDFGKPYALATLHRLGRQGEGRYDKFLCGGVQGGVVPSPVWIADLDSYQVVTVFGATQDPRSSFLKELRDSSHEFAQIWPMK